MKNSKTGKNAGLFDHYDEFVKDGITDKTLSAYVLYCARDLGMLDSY